MLKTDTLKRANKSPKNLKKKFKKKKKEANNFSKSLH